MKHTLATVALTAALGLGLAGTANATTHHKAGCHTAYTVSAHYVGPHTVAATKKHSAYRVYGHTVPAHTVKGTC